MWHIKRSINWQFIFVTLCFLYVQGCALETDEATDVSSFKIAGIVQQTIEGCTRHFTKLATRSEAPTSCLSNDILHIGRSGQIELLFHAKSPIGKQEEEDLKKRGATIVTKLELPKDLKLPPAYMVQAWVPYDVVDTVAALQWVAAITPPGYGKTDTHPTNPINSEGVGRHNADRVHNLNINGAGVTVGVISDGVANLAASQARNELPAVNVLVAGSGDEGTAMLEIVHDMAPGAALMFHATGSNVKSHVDALNKLRDNGANIITEDWGFDDQPVFQQGIATVTAEAIAKSGVSVYSSAGNRGDDHAARVQAIGTGGGPDGVNFTSTPMGCANTPDNVVAIAPGGDTTFDVTLGAPPTPPGTTPVPTFVSITLQWSEPRAIFPTVGQGGFTDLNLYVMDATLTRCLGQSVARQRNGVTDTIEQISIAVPPGTTTAAKIIVDVQGTSSAVAAPLLDLRWRNMQAETDATTRAGSLNPDSNYTGPASIVAAVNTMSGTVETFSSGGPVQLGLTTVCPGNIAGPCTGVAGPGITTINGRPNLAAADGVAVSGIGFFPTGSGTCPAINPGDCRFFGTSAAAPHAAGCEALLRDGFGGPTSPIATNLLASNTTDIAPAGIDDITGSGRLNCVIREAFLPDGPPFPAAFPTSPGRKAIYAVTRGGRLAQIWDTNKWNVDFPTELADPPFNNLRFHRGVAVFPTNLAADKKAIYAVTTDGRLAQIWDTNKWNVDFPAELADPSFNNLRFQNGIDAFLTGSNKKAIYAVTTDGRLAQIWDTNKWNVDFPAELAGPPFNNLRFHKGIAAFPTGSGRKAIYAVTTDGRLAQIWDTNKWNVDFPAELADPPFNNLRFQDSIAAFPTGSGRKAIYAVTTDGRLAQIWDTNKWNVDFPAELAGPPFNNLRFHKGIATFPTGSGRKTIYAITGDGRLAQIWDTNKWNVDFPTELADPPFNNLRF
jgi:hypothetical protein